MKKITKTDKMKLQSSAIKIMGANQNLTKIKPRGHSRLKNDQKPKKSHLQQYLEKRDPYADQVKSEFQGVIKKAIKELSEGIIKSNASEDYLEKLKRDEIIARLQLRIQKMETYRKVYLIRREQIEGPAEPINTEDSEEETLGLKDKSTIPEEPSKSKSQTFSNLDTGNAVI